MPDDIEERLAAFLDGEMSEAEAAAFEAQLAADPALAARAEAWCANDDRISAAFAPVAAMPLPQDLLAKLEAVPDVIAASKVTAANDNPPAWRRFAMPLGGALAASLAALFLIGPKPEASGGRDLSYALETGRSLQPVRLADGQTVTPTMTIRTADGRFCREFQQADTTGLACRSDGKWAVEAKAAGTGPSEQTGIAVAGGADASALDAAYKRLGASDPLGAAEEAKLISGNWQAD